MEETRLKTEPDHFPSPVKTEGNRSSQFKNETLLIDQKIGDLKKEKTTDVDIRSNTLNTTPLTQIFPSKSYNSSVKKRGSIVSIQ